METYPRTTGSEHSYWNLAFAVRLWSPEAFGQALTAEGVPARPRYIGEPIYSCMQPLAAARTFGTSAIPLRARDRYARGLCPRAEEALEHMVVISVSEAYSDDDTREVGDAIEKVARLLPVDPDRRAVGPSLRRSGMRQSDADSE